MKASDTPLHYTIGCATLLGRAPLKSTCLLSTTLNCQQLLALLVTCCANRKCPLEGRPAPLSRERVSFTNLPTLSVIRMTGKRRTLSHTFTHVMYRSTEVLPRSLHSLVTEQEFCTAWSHNLVTIILTTCYPLPKLYAKKLL